MGEEKLTFPNGLRVLVVDDSPSCLELTEKLLQKCNYNVSVTTEPKVALQMLKENCDQYDIVITDVNMPSMNGFDFLENISTELKLDIPVVFLSEDDDTKQVMKGLEKGAVDYLLKPVRIQELKLIWQHVFKKKEQRKRKANDNIDPTIEKKGRLGWTFQLHEKFVAALDQLGKENSYPKKIMEVMNVEGLTREKVASHLQKYRVYLKNREKAQLARMQFGVHNTSTYPSAAFSSFQSGLTMTDRNRATMEMLDQMNSSICPSMRSTITYTPGTGTATELLNQMNARMNYQSTFSQDPSYNLENRLYQDQTVGGYLYQNQPPYPLTVFDQNHQGFYGNSSFMQDTNVEDHGFTALMEMDDNYSVDESELLAQLIQDKTKI